MPALVGVHELLFFGWRKVADLKNNVDMIGGDWRWIVRIGYLADEAAVLGESNGKTLAGPRRALVKHTGQNILIRGNCLA